MKTCVEYLQFNIYKIYPAIITLEVYLKNQEYVYCNKHNVINRIKYTRHRIVGFLNLTKIDLFAKL